MATYAVIEKSTGNIVNVILLDDPDAWEVPEGHIIIEQSTIRIEEHGTLAGPGGTYTAGVYTPPPTQLPARQTFEHTG